jgi:signal transduction histidine kinase
MEKSWSRPPLSALGIIDDRDYARLTATILASLGAVGTIGGLIAVRERAELRQMNLLVPMVFSAATLLLAGVVAKRPAFAPIRRVSVFISIGTVILGAVLIACGPDLFPHVAVQFMWGAAAFPFVTRRRALAHLASVFIVLAVVIAVQSGHWNALVEWEIAAGGIAVAAGVVEWVVGRVTSLALEERATRHQLEAANDRLEEVNQQKRDFLAAMSHELRTPLNAIVGFAEVLGEELYGSLNERQADYVDDIRSSGNDLRELIGGVLDLTKVESGALDLHVAMVDVDDLVRRTVGLFKEHAVQRHIDLRVETSGPVRVEGDQGKLRQVLVNLLTNALKFTPEGGNVVVVVRPENGEVVVSVRDTGPGIAPGDQDRIFLAFEQTSAGTGLGTGLGLPLARRLMQLHGGRLDVASEPGSGSTFSFRLGRRLPEPSVRVDDVHPAAPFESEEARRQNTRVVAGVSLWGSALGVFVLLNLWLTDSTDLLGFHLWEIVFFAGPAVALGLALLARPTALTAPRFVVAYFLFLAVAGSGMYFAGPLIGTAISGFFVWGTLALFILLPRRHALALVGVAGAVLALVIGARPGYSVPALRWELTMAACLGPGLLTAWLVTKLHELQTAEQSARVDVERSGLLLEQVSRHKSEFLANMSHELRTPLNAIIGFAEILREQLFGPLNERQAEYIDDIVESGRQLLALIDDILDLARAEAGRIELIIDDVGVDDLLQRAIAEHAADAAQRDLHFTVSVDSDATEVKADSTRLGQAVGSLISNAVKFSPPGADIDVRASRHNGSVVVAVHDRGPGIAPSDQARIFEEFQQAAPTGLATPGAGLGLTLARTFAELHDGRLEVESEPGNGSTFRLAIPARQASTHWAAPPHPRARPIRETKREP